VGFPSVVLNLFDFLHYTPIFIR